MRFVKLTGPEAVRMKGRGRVEIQCKPIESQTRTMHSMTCRAMELKRAAGGHAAQANELTNIARNMQRMRCSAIRQEVNRQINEDTIAGYVKQTVKLRKVMKHDGVSEDQVAHASRRTTEDNIETLKEVCIDEPIHAGKALGIAGKHREMSVKLCAAVKADNHKLQRQATEDGKRGVKHIGKKIDQSAAPPLRFVKRDDKCTDGGAPGTITTDPRQIGRVVTRAWMKIYQERGQLHGHSGQLHQGVLEIHLSEPAPGS